MGLTFDVKKDFEIKKKLVVDGTEYDSLDQVPAERREAIEQAMASGTPATTIRINGETIANTDELPAPLRAVVRGLVDIAVKGADGTASATYDDAVSQPGAVKPEPIFGVKTLLILLGLAAVVFWLVRSVI